MTHGQKNTKLSSVYVPPSMWATKFHTHTKQAKIIVLYILICKFLDTPLRYQYTKFSLASRAVWQPQSSTMDAYATAPLHFVMIT